SYAPFYGMTNVREFTLKGDKLPSAPYPDIFYSMNRLQTVYVTEKAYHSFSSVYSQYINNAKYRVEGYDGDFVINSENELLVYQGNDTTVAIPDEVETISVSAFQNNSTIEEVVLNENLTKIDSYACENCVNLKNVKMNRNLESIGSRAFYNCTSLNEINFSEAISSIGSYAFFGCTGLRGELRIPETVKSIGNYAFSGDNSLEKVKIAGNSEGTSIGSYAFQNCKGMTSVDLGSVKTIGAYAFQNCSSLSSTLTIPDSVVSANEGAFAGCSKIEEVKISEKLTAISSYLFDGCISLCGEIIVPDSVETIYDYAFRNCKNVTSVVLGSNVSTIGSNNYYGYSPFLGMTAVKQFMFRGSVVPKCAYPDIFYSMNSLETIYIPANTESDYVKAFDTYKNNAVFSSDTMRYEVKNLKISNIYSSTVKLEWSAHQSEKVESYVVERNNEIVATVKNCQYIDYDLETGETYTYSVYGVTAGNEKTGVAKVQVTPQPIQFTDITTSHSQNTISELDGVITVNAVNNSNGYTLEGEPVSGKLYYIDNDKRVFIGKSTLTVGEKLQFNVNWDVKDVPAGEYDVVFVYTDPDGYESETTGKVRVDKSMPEKIVNVFAVGDYNSILVSWAQSSEVDSKIYKIYRKSEVDTDFSLIATIKNRTTLSYTDTNVKKDRLYYYYVITENSFGLQSEPSDEAVAMRAVDTEAPIVTKIIPSSYSYINGSQVIKVEATDNLMLGSAKLYYSLDEENWTLIDSCTSSPFSFTFNTTSLEDGEVYVKAVVYDAQGNESEGKVAVYKVDNSGPSAVRNLVVSSVLASKATLKWQEPASGDAVSYVLEQKLSNGNFKVIQSGITTNGFVIEGLKPQSSYTYRVAAVDAMGNIGEYSEEIVVSTDVDTQAPVITALSPSASRRNSTINFSASAGDDYGVKSLAIQISTNKTDWETLSSANFSNVSKTVSYSFNVDVDKFDDGSIYVRAVATDFSGNVSDTSETAPFVEYVIDKTAPDSPRDLVAAGGEDYIYLSWVQGDESDLGTYSVYRSIDENEGYIQLASGLKNISYYDTTAKRNTTYYYKIAALDTLGNVSKFSNVVKAKVADDVTPPEVVSVTPDNNSSISKSYHTVSALVKDNSCVDSVTFEYKVNSGSYKVFKTVTNIGNYYATVDADIPLTGIKENDNVCVRIFCKDITGLKSGYSNEYSYTYDESAPAINNLTASIEKNTVSISWSDNKENDIAGFKVYRIYNNGSEVYIGAVGVSSSHSYNFTDSLKNLAEGSYTYKVYSFDEGGNSISALSEPVTYKKQSTEIENNAPEAVINGMNIMQVGVEEIFDGYSSTDDDSIVSYKWDFGDGTSSNDIQAVKKYSVAGEYTVTLTVTDSFGKTGKATFAVTVNQRETIGKIKVKVVDDNGKLMKNAPVYYNLGDIGQQIVYTDSTGMAERYLNEGTSNIGCYMSGYLPAKKEVTVLPNATRTITLTLIKEELVTGKFEVTRMTFNEIVDAGVDVYDPANQNVFSVEVTLRFGEEEVPVKYIRNEKKIIKYVVNPSKPGEPDPEPEKKTGPGSSIKHIEFISNSKNEEFIAILRFDAKAKALKEFFDVKLYIVNNATSDFVIKNNSVDLYVPDGLTMMKNLASGWETDSHVEFKEIRGQQTKSFGWVLRGDKEGEYDLKADYNGILDEFNENVKATFKTDEPINVMGMSNLMFEVEV
ncbi:MAG: leucine-rich repeat protein, partial [Ruminococcus sp.]